MTRKSVALLLGSALLLSHLSSAATIGNTGLTFSPAADTEVVQSGAGGEKITRHGIDYWTTGSPPRRYRVLGKLTDERFEDWGGGYALGSAKIARTIREAGGTAAIVTNASVASPSTDFKPVDNVTKALGANRTVTTMTVIRYVD